MNIKVHPETCMAIGLCRAAAPDVFGADARGWVRLLSPPAADRFEDVLVAAESCPTASIQIDEGE